MLWAHNSGAFNTKMTMEDVFGTMKDIGRVSRNKVVNKHRLFWEITHNKFYTDNPNLDHIGIAEEDWSSELAIEGGLDSIRDGIFHGKSHEITCPQIDVDTLLTKKAIVAEAEEKLGVKRKVKGPKNWRPAGPAAMHREVAAANLLIRDAKNGFANIGKAWMSCLLFSTCIFQMPNGQCWISLGHARWGALSWLLDVVEERREVGRRLRVGVGTIGGAGGPVDGAAGLQREPQHRRLERLGEGHGLRQLAVGRHGDLVPLVVLVLEFEALGAEIEAIGGVLVDLVVRDGVSGCSKAANVLAVGDLHDDCSHGLGLSLF